MADSKATQLVLLYNGANISGDIARDMISFDFTDNASDQADDLQVVLQDRRGLWRSAWQPEKGATLTASIVPAFGGGMLYCGTFEIDDLTYSGPPNQVAIKAVSTGITNSLRREKMTRAWEDYTLEKICTAIASAASMSAFYDAPEIRYQRVDQRDESALGFLRRLCGEAGLNVKVSDRNVVVYSEEEYEKRPPIASIDVMAGDVVQHSVRTKSHDVYRDAVIKYRKPADNALIEYTYTPDPQPPTGQTLKIRQRAENIDAARRICKRELRNKNRQEVEADVTVVGNPRLQAGQNVALSGVGALSDIYHIDTARHSYDDGGGYVTEISCHRALAFGADNEEAP